MSIDDRAKLRQNHREGKERMKLASIAEDMALYEERYEGSLATRTAKASNASKRRQSYAFRNGDARRIRELFAKMEAERGAMEHESYELKWAGERDAEAYKRQMDRERRESLAFRNAEGSRIRDVEATMKSDDRNNEHESYELKWAGERDAEAYRRQMAQERRESFAFRNEEGRRIRDVEATMKSDESNREHESYELKWAGERDAEAYRQQMAKERRESFAFRNEEGARHDAVMKELRSLAKEQEHESYMLKWAGENDAKQYLADEQELRRQSLAFRNAEGRRHREIEEDMRANQVLENHKHEELAAACK
jgi:hypothetical protein